MERGKKNDEVIAETSVNKRLGMFIILFLQQM